MTGIPAPDHLRAMFAYMRWADDLILRAALALPEDEYFAPRGFSLGSIHKLLVHAMAAQKAWLSRWNGTMPARIEDERDHPTRERLAERWPLVHDDLAAFLDRQTPVSLAAPLDYTNFAGQPFRLPLGGLMLHVIDHSAYHRGQLNSMIKLAGGEPAPAFYTLYLAARPGSS